MSTRRITDRGPPIVVCAADDAYALCLAAMTASLIHNNRHPAGLQLIVLDGGISDYHREMLARAWDGKAVAVEWVRPNLADLEGFPVSEHVSAMTYARTLLPFLLPAEVSRVIYLDCDLVVEADISGLWAQEFNGSFAMAVQDAAAPLMNSEEVLPNFPRVRRRLAAARPIANYEAFGFDAFAQNFNGGVLYIDLEAWRKHDVSQQLHRCLAENEEHVLWWDQYALNVVLYGRWKSLDRRWNQTPHVLKYPSWQDSPFGKEDFEQAVSSPYIFHYASPVKPWQFGYLGPKRDRFFHYLYMSEWRGWRPRINSPEAFRSGREYLRAVKRRWFPRGA